MFTATYNNNNIIIINTQLTEKTVTVMSHCNFLKKNAWTVFRECLKLLTSSNCDWRQWCKAAGRIAEHQLLRNLCQQTQFVGGWVWICLASTENLRLKQERLKQPPLLHSGNGLIDHSFLTKQSRVKLYAQLQTAFSHLYFIGEFSNVRHTLQTLLHKLWRNNVCQVCRIFESSPIK